MLARAGHPRARFTPWTDAEDSVLREHYHRGPDAAVRHLPSRSRVAIKQRAWKLGLHARHPWNAVEDRKLAVWWESGLRLDAIAKKMDCTKTAVYHRARQIGLRLGCPDGFEYVTQAAKRTGFHGDTLLRILDAADVQQHTSLSAPWMKDWGGNYRWRYVDPIEVDEAVAAWMASEPVTTAARRHGIADQVLRRWLRKEGVIGGASKQGKPHQRVRSEVVDRVVAERRARSGR